MKYFLALVLSAILCYTEVRLYQRGLADGEQNYKQSNRIYLALKSAYHYGYTDCKAGRPEDWDGPDLE